MRNGYATGVRTVGENGRKTPVSWPHSLTGGRTTSESEDGSETVAVLSERRVTENQGECPHFRAGRMSRMPYHAFIVLIMHVHESDALDS